jgi:inhibitor of KinA
MNHEEALPLEPMGDQAVLARCVTEAQAFAVAESVRRRAFAWLVDVVQAYSTVAIFYDPACSDYFQVAHELASTALPQCEAAPVMGRLHVLPCCYEQGLDLLRVAQHIGRPGEEVIALHCGSRYTIYAIGFCPGFPYMGYLPAALCGVPRLETPRIRVEAGSVGLTGRQTGIYTEVRPGGWNIVGRTPLCLVDVADGYFPLRTGDQVVFQRIDERDYRRLLGERLAQR